MRVKGEAFSKRLEGYTNSTIQLIMNIKNGKSKKKALQATEIIATTDNEQEVVQKLQALMTDSL